MVIGYTTGVFDLFHIGHLNIIKQAKEHCDYLIVGVTTDELTEQLKHHPPTIPYIERAEIIKSLVYVDQVVAEHDVDKVLAWHDYHYNVIFKGSDWKGTPLWNSYEKQFKALGVEVYYFPYTEGTSSTLINDYLKKSVANK